MLSDLRFALRQLVKSPGFTVIAVVTLALGIGANTATFSVINSVLLQPLPYPHSEQLVQIWQRLNETGEPGIVSGYSVKQWRAESQLLDGVASTTLSGGLSSATVTGNGPAEQVTGLFVSANYLKVLRVSPLLGRDFSPDADLIGGANHVVLLTHEMWQTRFGGDPAAVNRTIILDEVPHTIVGILPKNALLNSDVRFLRPLVIDDPAQTWRSGPTIIWLCALGRMKPGVTPAQLTEELNALHRTHLAELPIERRNSWPVVIPLREQISGTMRPTLLLLLGVGSLILLIACANVANLLLVRAIARQKEMAVRLALGGGVRRIASLVLTKSILLSLLGTGLAVLLAMFALDFIGPVTEAIQPGLSPMQRGMRTEIMGTSLPGILRPEVNWTVFLFSATLALATSVASGLVPALRACRVDLARDLKQSSRGGSRSRSNFQSLLVAGQIGLTAMLLIGAGLFLRSLAKTLAVDPGFDPHHAVVVGLVTPTVSYPDAERAARFREEVMGKLGTLPGVETVGTSNSPPFRNNWIDRIGLPGTPDHSDLFANWSAIGGDYFRALDTPLLQGRRFSLEDDKPDARVVILNEMLARALFGAQDPIGRTVRLPGNSLCSVVGVVGDVHEVSLETPGNYHYYFPRRFTAWGATSVIVRTSGAPAGMLKAIGDAIRSLDPNQPLANLHPLDEDIRHGLRGKQAMLGLVIGFAALALVLACIGTYGVMAFTVGQRERELGIRLALGATQTGVLGLVLRDGLRLSLFGLGTGLIAAGAGARLMASMLFGISTHDPMVFSAVAAILAAVAAGACWLPARRATQVDPMVVLRAE